MAQGDDTTDDTALPAGLESPEGTGKDKGAYGSDVAADTLRALGIRYVAINPGASFRGLHDSIVNHLGNRDPQLILCLHEEHAVAIAHGYAKVTGEAMAAAVHANVGLMHATMAIFNAWCDRMPVLVVGATGPEDAAKRRPWIEWIHTARDQGALVRGYTKWDDQPGSPAAMREALTRAKWLADTTPQAPVYVNLDAGVQEAPLTEPLTDFDADRLRPAAVPAPAPDALAEAARVLRAAKSPVMLVGRASRSEAGWRDRIRLAEALGAGVVTDLKVGAGFPTDHPLHRGAPGIYPVPAAADAIRTADAILSLDWVDPGGTFKMVLDGAAPNMKVIHVSSDHFLHKGWSMDYQVLPPVDVMLAAVPDETVRALCEAIGAPAKPATWTGREPEAPEGDGPLMVADLAHQLRQALGDRPVSLTHLPLSWDGAFWPFRHPLDFLGSDGGGGIGGGPGISVGASLALKGSGRMPVSICGDGDFLMGATSLWTAVHYRLPLLLAVANNQSFFNDEVHQERVARMRDRPVENKWIGQRISDPEVDLAGMARVQGATGFGPITDRAGLADACASAVAEVERGGVVVIDARVATGYTPAMQTALARSSE